MIKILIKNTMIRITIKSRKKVINSENDEFTSSKIDE